MLAAAAYKARSGKRVLVIDCDSQATVVNTRALEKGKGFDLIGFDWMHSNANDRFKKLIAESDNKYDVVFIDAPGKMEGREVEFTILYSDVICIPIVARPIDIQSTLTFLEAISPVIEARKQQGFETLLLGIPNKLDNTIEMQYLPKLQGKQGMFVLKNGLSNRIRYVRDVSTVKSVVLEYKQDEFNVFFKEFLNVTGI